jgi:outer membrane protein TolC
MKPDFLKIALLLLAGIVASPLADRNCQGQPPAPYRLTLQDAIQKALQANLNVLAAGTRVDEAEGARQRSMAAALLPRVNAQTYANYQNRDLRAFGISLPPIPGFAGLPSVVGPFSNYDFRIYAQQNVIDLESYRTFKASELAVDAGKMDERDARDLIVRSIAALYLNGQSAAARVDAAQSRVRDSTTLLKLASDKHDAGTATGVDVLRAQVQLANDKQALLVAQNALKQSLLTLARNLGMSPGTAMEIATRHPVTNCAQSALRLSLALEPTSGPSRAAARQPRPLLSKAQSERQHRRTWPQHRQRPNHGPDSGPDRLYRLRSRPERRG